jgi:hypothetical protein
VTTGANAAGAGPAAPHHEVKVEDGHVHVKLG